MCMCACQVACAHAHGGLSCTASACDPVAQANSMVKLVSTWPLRHPLHTACQACHHLWLTWATLGRPDLAPTQPSAKNKPA